MNYFTMDNPVDRVHAWWTGAGSRGPPWTDGGVDRWPQSTAMPSLEHGLRPLQSMEARRRGHNRERGTWGTRLGPYRGSGGGKVAGQQSEMAAVVGAQ
jgi:hypothetical protein